MTTWNLCTIGQYKLNIFIGTPCRVSRAGQRNLGEIGKGRRGGHWCLLQSFHHVSAHPIFLLLLLPPLES